MPSGELPRLIGKPCLTSLPPIVGPPLLLVLGTHCVRPLRESWARASQAGFQGTNLYGLL